jgi:hypothetical protein
MREKKDRPRREAKSKGALVGTCLGLIDVLFNKELELGYHLTKVACVTRTHMSSVRIRVL